MLRILILLPTTTYRAGAFIAAAQKMGVSVVAASDRPNTMSRHHPGAFLTLNFRDLESCVGAVQEFHSRYPINAVIPVDDETAVAAAAIGAALSLKHNSIESAQAAGDKYKLARLLTEHTIQAPRTVRHSIHELPEALAGKATYPCVLKPLFLSASRGVIRADDPIEFAAAWKRILAILQSGDIRARGGAAAEYLLEQEFVPGSEFAVEGMLDNGLLRILAFFDKPDPLDGPFFEETIYVTPSRAARSDQSAITGCVADAARAIGLREGPIHAEVRLNGRGPWLIEIAARSIGGLCSRTLKFGTGLTLEDLILRHALGLDISDAGRESKAAGVMMIPIHHGGILEEVAGIEEARAVPGIEDVNITARPGNALVPLPEGSSYLGFIFSRAECPEEAEAALRRAHKKLRCVILPEGSAKDEALTPSQEAPGAQKALSPQ
ncbi:MAG TPA: ATP-grasp domain-containing protein [Acidobacteriota bacterium]|nr:ATP-grasp domain-containing protein [Acidobacteriota bacterium]